MPTAEAYISSCVIASCASNTIDVASALNLYTEYCSSTGIAPSPIVLATTTTINAGSTSTSNGPPVIIQTATVTANSAAGSRSTTAMNSTSDARAWATTTPTINSPITSHLSSSTTTEVVTLGNGNSKSGLSVADKIALGCGISIPMATLLVTIYLCLIGRPQ
ncbi:hypothetical protein BDZ45DRAFT_788259 [Acephala macrosclerotiorum]|nr:hypothetical protein BDZ45DRAFT_788259 [Acephala macrosclerotiorum]